jgi:hypothetical protein
MLSREPFRQASVNEENFRVSLRMETVKGIVTNCRLAWSTQSEFLASQCYTPRRFL